MTLSGCYNEKSVSLYKEKKLYFLLLLLQFPVTHGATMDVTAISWHKQFFNQSFKTKHEESAAEIGTWASDCDTKHLGLFKCLLQTSYMCFLIQKCWHTRTQAPYTTALALLPQL